MFRTEREEQIEHLQFITFANRKAVRAILLLIPLLGVVNLFFLFETILPDMVFNILRFILISTQVRVAIN